MQVSTHTPHMDTYEHILTYNHRLRFVPFLLRSRFSTVQTLHYHTDHTNSWLLPSLGKWWPGILFFLSSWWVIDASHDDRVVHDMGGNDIQLVGEMAQQLICGTIRLQMYSARVFLVCVFLSILSFFPLHRYVCTVLTEYIDILIRYKNSFLMQKHAANCFSIKSVLFGSPEHHQTGFSTYDIKPKWYPLMGFW